jgi:predicted nucleic acid-binding protein
MKNQRYLFDSNAIYRLIRETPEKALEKLSEGTTIHLAYYELGNALWRECRLLKRLSSEEAEKSLDLMYAMLMHMHIATVGNSGKEILAAANQFNLTYYDAAFLVEAMKTNIILVTDDAKLAKTAETLGVATAPSSTLIKD